MRPLFIAGNWKMNPATLEEAVALAEAVKAGVGQAVEVRVAVCPPSVYLQRSTRSWPARRSASAPRTCTGRPRGPTPASSPGACSTTPAAPTSSSATASAGTGWARPTTQVNRKLHAALGVGLLPIVCIGETREEREADRTEAVVAEQLDGSLAGLSPEAMAGVVLAYEPVWAIGTGLTATPEQAQAVHAFIRTRLARAFGEATAARVVVQYGGSVKADNAGELLACPDIDGALVGGASLQAADFLGIFQAARGVTASGKP